MSLTLTPSVRAYDQHAARYAQWAAAQSMASQLERFSAGVPAGGRILDAGCGTGRDLAGLGAAGFDVVGADLSAGMLAQAAATVAAPLLQADLRRLPFAEASFDGVWSCASLVHLDYHDAAAALAEFHRVLRPGAALYATAKAGDDRGSWSETDYGRRWFFFWKPETFAEVVSAAGFEMLGSDDSSPAWVGSYARRRI